VSDSEKAIVDRFTTSAPCALLHDLHPQVVSDSEKAIVDRFTTSVPVHVVSNIYEPQGKDFHCEGRQGLLFVGNLAHEPNRCAVLQTC